MAIFNRKPRHKARDEPRALALEVPRRSADSYLGMSEALSAAASRIANTMAMVPLRLYKGAEVQKGHPLDKLMYFSPGPGMNRFTFVRDMEINRCTLGRAYAWIVRTMDGVGVERLMILDPMRVETLRVIETGDIWHRVTLSDGEGVLVPDMDMLFLSFLSDGRRARPVDILRGTMQYDADIKDVSVSQLRGVNDTIVVETPGEMGKEKKKRLVEELVEVYHSTGKAAMLLDAGMKATHLSGQAVDPKVLDVERVTKGRVSTVYGIPPAMLGAAENTRGSSEEAMMEFREMAIMPPMAQWEAELDKKLLTYAQLCAGLCWHFDRDQLAQANTDTRTKMYHSAIRDGYMRPNEVRRKLYLPDDENGNELMMSRDMIPIKINVQDPAMLLTGARGMTNNE